MTWTILFCLVLALGIAILGLLQRRAGLRALRQTLGERESARHTGSASARLQYPAIDLSRCVGCGACIRACPEDAVLGMVHGQAAVIHGSRCVGHGLCAEACPVDAVAVTLGDLGSRKDIPLLSDELEVEGVPGLFLAGEVTGYALVRTAIRHGQGVADRVRQRLAQSAAHVAAGPAGAAGAEDAKGGGGVPGAGTGSTLVATAPPLDLLIVGAGPAGLSCGLAAKAAGLDFLILERDSVGGTVAKYPRRKLVMTQPVDLPLYGRLKKSSYAKEELVGIWEQIVREQSLPVRGGEEFVGLSREGEGGLFEVRTREHRYLARSVCLCLGRRGIPRQLGVPGEDLPKVVYSLIDAASYRGRRILVVGGGDSAVEAAVSLAEQPGNEVILSYRKPAFSRIKAKNQARLDAQVAAGAIQLHLDSEVVEIRKDRVLLAVGAARPRQILDVVNDEVFVFAGGVPPFGLLEECGVSFDGSRRAPQVAVGEQGTGLLGALIWGMALTVATLAFCAAFGDYYGSSWEARPDSPWHGLLAPTAPVGLSLGVLATLLILINLVYLLRRTRLGEIIAGSVQHWLSIHAFTGILALLCLLVHGGMMLRDTSGGLAFSAVVVLVFSGAIGRYLYAHLPKAANGRNLEREETKAALQATLAGWDQQGRGLSTGLRQELESLVAPDLWGRSMFRRIGGLFRAKARLRRGLQRILRRAGQDGLAPAQIDELAAKARQLHRAGIMAVHFEELRGLVASWRLLHRWLALAMVLLAANHIVTALRFARLW